LSAGKGFPFAHLVVIMPALLYNQGLASLLRFWQRTKFINIYQLWVYVGIFQSGCDMIGMTLLIHFTGGVESPLFFFYTFEALGLGYVLPLSLAYMQSLWGVLCYAALILLEYHHVIPHYHLGFLDPDLYRDPLYLTAFLFIVADISFICAYLVSRFSDELAAKKKALLLSKTTLDYRVEQRTEELRQVLGELQMTNQELQRANRLKSEFLANMSHELRTPLNAVNGFSEVLLGQYFGPLNDKQVEYVNDILASGRHLLSLINEILDLSKIEAGKMQFDPRPFRLESVIDECLQLLLAESKRKKQRIEICLEPKQIEVTGDERRIAQVLQNLLENAVKFTPEAGWIKVHARSLGDAILIEVSDSGIGIHKEDQARIFEAFQQADSSLARKHQGSGLGLALSKKILELHGGRIWVESEPGKGSSFFMALPRVLLGNPEFPPETIISAIHTDSRPTPREVAKS
jgi:signal transduction histidine kinase